jgi:hypothetical protein
MAAPVTCPVNSPLAICSRRASRDFIGTLCQRNEDHRSRIHLRSVGEDRLPQAFDDRPLGLGIDLGIDGAAEDQEHLVLVGPEDAAPAERPGNPVLEVLLVREGRHPVLHGPRLLGTGDRGQALVEDRVADGAGIDHVRDLLLAVLLDAQTLPQQQLGEHRTPESEEAIRSELDGPLFISQDEEHDLLVERKAFLRGVHGRDSGSRAGGL